MAWAPGGSRQQGDAFATAERDVKALVGARSWAGQAAGQRQQAVAARVLALPDGSEWVFGAWARWYRKHAADTEWYLCPPPYATAVRGSARTAATSSPLPPHVVPVGPDFSAVTAADALPFVDVDLSRLTGPARAIVEAAAALSPAEYPRPEAPRWVQEFSPHVPVTVAVTWGVMLFCADAPVFDAALDDSLLALWNPYRVAPLPLIAGPRWLTPPTLEQLAGLYGERVRAGASGAASGILRTIWATASALREEKRFRPRADALLAILGGDGKNDERAAQQNDAALVTAWIGRCPGNLASSLRAETSAGEHLRHAFYDFAEALVPSAGAPGDVHFVEPRLIAASLLAADLSVIRQDVVGQVIAWLDPEVRYTIQAMIAQPGHPLRRRFWPAETHLPDQLRRATRDPAGLLASLYHLDLAWCRLGGGIPARPRGFPATIALLTELIGDRATGTTPLAPAAPNPVPAAPAWQQPVQPSQPAPDARPLPSPLTWGAHPQSPAAQSQPYGVPAGSQPWPGAPEAQPWAAQQDSDGPPVAAGQPWGAQTGPDGLPVPVQQPWGAQPGPEGQPAGQQWGAQQGGQPAGQQWGAQQGGPDAGQARDAQQPAAPEEEYGARRPAIQRGPTADELAQKAGKVFGRVFGRAKNAGGRLLGGGEPDPHSTGPLGFDQPDGPRQPPVPGPAGEATGERPRVAPAHGTQVMSETMVGNFLDYSPPAVENTGGGDPSAPSSAPAASAPKNGAPTVVRSGVTFVYGPEDDAAEFLDSLPVSATAGNATQIVTNTPSADQNATQPNALPQPGPFDRTLVQGVEQVQGVQPQAGPLDRTLVQGSQPQAGAHDRTLVQGVEQVQGAEQQGAVDAHATMLDQGEVAAALAEARGGRAIDPHATVQDSEALLEAVAEAKAGQVDQNATLLDQGALNAALAEARGAMPTAPDAKAGERPPRPDAHATMLDQGGAQGAGRVDPNATSLDSAAFQAAAAEARGRRADPHATMIDSSGGAPRTMLDQGGAAVAPKGPPAVSVLLVGGVHTGQRRLTRMIAQIVGDGGYRLSDAEDLRGLALERLATLFDPGGQTVLIERLDAAILEAADPKVFLRALRTIRGRAGTPMIATCDPRSFKRFVQDHPEVQEIFRVFRLPELRDVEQRSTLLGVLAQERRASLDGAAWAVAREDLGRLRGPGDLSGARLVEAYLDRACQRALGRGARDGLVVRAEDLTGVAESIEPALRPAGDVEGYLETLRDLLGIPEVKADVERLAEEADGPVNLLFEGPSGTGKTTVAGLVGGIFGALGLLPSGHLIQCRPVHLQGRDALETELKVAGMAQQADGGILLVQDADRLPQAVVSELFRGMREHPYMLIIAGTDLSRFLQANPDVAATFQRLTFVPPSDRELVRLFTGLAENKLYLVEEELRVELMARIARARDGEGFAYGRTIREWFEETVVRQARRLAGAPGADALTVARLTVRDLPESNLEIILGELHQTRRAEE
ncbi:hypothetical protein [Actinocorallia longicatena]|uniref:AAA+ ATPase domain-containing protein n=1 Tax=Actinocorallia longicatena TaxID=111803 RepID=A0ABP6QM00_9ACTN